MIIVYNKYKEIITDVNSPDQPKTMIENPPIPKSILFRAFAIIVIDRDSFTIVKPRVNYVGDIFPIEELPMVVNDLTIKWMRFTDNIGND